MQVELSFLASEPQELFKLLATAVRIFSDNAPAEAHVDV